MTTDFGDLPAPLLAAFEEAFPVSTDPAVAEEIAALEKLFGREIPEELARVIEIQRHEVLSPTPAQLVAQEHPFEALILRAQELNDCVPVLFPLTGSVYLRRHEGWADLLGHVPLIEGRPAMPFVGWRRDAWAYDLPSFLAVAAARTAFEEGREDEIEELLSPVWGRVGSNEYLQDLFYFLEDEGIVERLNEAWGDRPMLRPKLAQWWRHERALFYGFALMGKYRQPEPTAFDLDPNAALQHPKLLRSLNAQLETLCRGWFLESDEFIAQALTAMADSPSLLVQDAHRLFSEVRDGRRTVGSADFHEAREKYRVWVKDQEAYRRDMRTERRANLEAQLEPSEHGIELVRADWPLSATAVTTSEPARNFSWNGQTCEFVADGNARTLEKPPQDASLYLGLTQPKATLSPSGRKLLVPATQNRPTADGRSRENAPVLVEHDLEAGSWRVLTNAKDGQWVLAFDEDRWVYRDARTVYLLRDVGEPLADATYTAAFTQLKSFCIPEMGVLIGYGSADLANGRPLDDRNAPWVQIIGFWRDRLAQVAAFPVDGVELVAEHANGKWRVGLVSADRAVAWEIRGLESGIGAWRDASMEAERAERAKREAFGEVTVHNAIEACNLFLGTQYGSEMQEGVSKVFDQMMETLRADAAVVAAAKESAQALDFVEHVKGPFANGLTNAGLGPGFMDFALNATIFNPQLADIVVRAATTSAWKALREQG